MIKSIPLVLFLLLSSATAQARTVVVRAGEHAQFTRVTVEIPSNAEWSIDRGQRSARLKIEQPEIQFDTSQVFVRIPKTRLIDVSHSASLSELVLKFGCDCGVDWFIQSRNLLVVDIKDGNAKLLNAGMLPLPLHEQPLRFAIAATSRQTQPSMPSRLPDDIQGFVGLGPDVPDDPAEPMARLEVSDVGLNLSERRLLEQIGRASKQGLLTPVAPPSTKTEVKNPEPNPTAGTSTSVQASSVNVIASTTVDQGLSLVSDALSHRSESERCISPELVAIHEWGDDRQISEQISERRAALYGEFDLLDTDAAKRLAQTYLYFGFGAEARNILTLLPARDLQRAFLNTVAQIVDNERVPELNPFLNQEDCDGTVPLWSILSQTVRPQNIDTANLLRTFVNLPDHLKVLFGPRLSEVFSISGETGVSETILRVMDRTGTVQNAGKIYSDGIIEKSSGNIPEAMNHFEDVMQSNSEYSVRSLAELIEMNWIERASISQDVSDLAAAYATELRDSEDGMLARRALAISLALNGRYASATDALGTISQRDGAQSMASAAVPVFTLTVEDADDVTFLQVFFANMSLLQATQSTELQEKAAKRLLDLGFPQAAMDLLTRSSTPGSQQRTLLRAEAAIDLGLPHRALVDLLSASGPDADELRGRAMQETGEYQLAGQALLSAGMVEESARWLWLADTLDAVPTDDRSPYAEVARLTDQLYRTGPEANAMTPLAGARAILSDSENIRREIIQLMELIPPSNSL